ncbi:MAG: Ig-like domain-containing protein [Planctomycetota bacterium]
MRQPRENRAVRGVGWAIWVAAVLLGVGFGPLASPAFAQNPGLITGRHYYAVENQTTGAIDQRGLTGSLGVAFSNLILRPNTNYRMWVLNAESFEIARYDFATGRPGTRIELPELALRPHNPIDSDGDELSDVGELIVGTDVANPDTDGDGIRDGAEVRQGADPTDGQPVQTGILASVGMPGPAVDVSVLDDLLVVAHENGLTAMTVFTGLNPAIVATVSTPGVVTRVASSGRTVAAAAGSTGLLILDFSSPPIATVTHVVPPAGFPATALGFGSVLCVASAANFAYVGLSNGLVAAVDLVSGFVLSSTDLGAVVNDLGIEGDVLYAVTTNQLRAIPLDPTNLVPAGAVTSTVTGSFSRIFVGGGVAYGVHNRGFNAFGLVNPTAPTLLRATSTAQLGWRDLAVDGAAIGIGAVGATFGSENLSLYDVADMATAAANLSDRFLTTLMTPGSTRAVEIANGVAYVADHASGLQVVNYLAADNLGVPPTVALAGNFDLMTAEEGKRVRVSAVVTDDIAVRSVEFFIDGESMDDPTFPFEHYFVTPLLTEQPSFTLRARAFDTGGNFTFTDEVTVTLTPDVSLPVVVNTLPNGGVVGGVASVVALISEPLDPSTVNSGTFTILAAGPDNLLGTGDESPVLASSVEFRGDILGAVMNFSPALGPGVYRARLDEAVKDLSGNALTAEKSWVFVVYPDTDVDMNGVPDGLEDFDGDGLVNAYEILLGLDPNVADFNPAADSDADGVLDLIEIALGTNPTLLDTDGDGFSDFDESGLGSSGLDPQQVPIFNSFALYSLANDGNVNVAFSLPTVHNQGAIFVATQVPSVRNDAAPEAIAGETVPKVVSVENQGNP